MSNAFDEVRLPLKIGFGTRGGPAFSTEIVTLDGGFERRNQNWSQARRRYDARTGLGTPEDVTALTAFFQARAGRARGFRLKDWTDYSSAANGTAAPQAADQFLGQGDGAQLQFQLRKTYQSGAVAYQRQISKPVAGTVLVALNGVVQTAGWSADNVTGIVTFALPPALGVTVAAGYEFDVPVRFDTDHLALTMEEALTQRGAIPLIELRVL
jgi:uncharacterized protein (TIGR02217 family)